MLSGTKPGAVFLVKVREAGTEEATPQRNQCAATSTKMLIKMNLHLVSISPRPVADKSREMANCRIILKVMTDPKME